MTNGTGFLWGVASSGYQCEGGFNGAGQPRNNWADAEEAGRVMKTGGATDFWNRYAEDFARCREIGLNAFRLSIEWARVQPSTVPGSATPPEFDRSALDHYAGLIASCRSHGLEPVVTLHHFTHPAWVGVNAWLSDKTPELFENFVAVSMEHINRRLIETHGQAPVHWVVTINEPNMLVLNTYVNRQFPGEGATGLGTSLAAFSRLLAGHIRAYNAIHDLYEARGWPAPRVTMNTFCSDAYWSENLLLDMLHLRAKNIPRDNLQEYFRSRAERLERAVRRANLEFPNSPFVWIGRAVHWFVDQWAPSHVHDSAMGYFLKALDESKRPAVLDYLGLDYYDPFTGHIFRPPSFGDLEFRSKSLHGHLMNGLSRKWWDWHFLPEGLHFFCSYYAAEYPGLGILIAENGMALRRKPDNSAASHRRDRLTRSEFLAAHIAMVRRLVAEGVPMLGYLHWSITDNYEWGSYTPRFGLFSVDYAHGAERSATDHLGDCPSQTYARLIRGEDFHRPA